MTINPFPGGKLIRFLWKLTKTIYFKNKNEDSTYGSIDVSPKERVETIHVKASNKNASNYIKEIFKELVDFPGVDLYIHGSWADDSRTPFSDLDDLVVVDTENILSLKLREKLISALNTVDMRFCRIDPLQHHGHWIIGKEALQNYDESYIPLTVLEGSICVQGSQDIQAKVNIIASQAGLKRNVKKTIENIDKFHDQYEKGSINLYEMKRYVGSILLLPAYVFQVQGMRVSKKYAIENSNDLFSDRAMRSIISCSSIRAEWGKVTSDKSLDVLRIFSRYFSNPHLFRQFSKVISPVFPAKEFIEISSDSISALTSEAKKIAGFEQ